MIKINCNLTIVLTNISLGKAETIVSTSQVVGQPAVFFDRFGGVWVSTRQWEIVTYVDVKQLYDKWSLISKQIDTLNKNHCNKFQTYEWYKYTDSSPSLMYLQSKQAEVLQTIKVFEEIYDMK